jgi:hypothetical protein
MMKIQIKFLMEENARKKAIHRNVVYTSKNKPLFFQLKTLAYFLFL